ncbi:arylsulfatase J-like [Ptychodera flava]|uniref:arylsulfatase J-like n=1 Tax=Ptychodera flava TaxID=63121 RepID=UPI003969BE84
MAIVRFLACIICWLGSAGTITTEKPPHIIFILADDLGWDDVSFHGSDQIPTPNIDDLAYNGVILHNYYVQPLCTPTRSALLTGKYPIHTGLQHFVITPDEPVGLPLNESTLANYLKKLGYATHLVGKWHLGYFAKEYTPTYRGFDSHYGFYLGHQDYYTHFTHWQNYWGFDLRHDMDVQRSVFGDYSTELFTTHAENIIRKHDPDKPLFLYFAHQAVHFSNNNQLEAPYRYTSRFPYILDERRKTYAGMVSALDESVGNVTRVLKESGLYNNSVIIFSTDNGGPSEKCESFNTPLRGTKSTLWEGGVRGDAFIHSKFLEKPKRLCSGMMHITDWLPTLYHIAGGNVSDLHHLDGFNMWDTISRDIPSPRTEILHNIDPIYANAALRVGDYKVIIGEKTSDWFVPPGITKEQKNTTIFNNISSDPRADVIHCGPVPSEAHTNCQTTKPCLYNIKDDPCEYYNLADKYPDILQMLLNKLDMYNSTALKPWVEPADPRADPKLHNYTWMPWVELTDVKTETQYH